MQSKKPEFELSPRHRTEIATIFGQSIEEAEQPRGAISHIENAVAQFLDQHCHNAGEIEYFPNADPASMKRQRCSAERLYTAVIHLQELIDSAVDRDTNIIDPDDFRSNILGALALTGPIRRKRMPFTEDDTPEMLAFLRTGEFALHSIRCGLDHLAKAATVWKEYCSGQKGRSPSANNDLILRLHDACKTDENPGSASNDRPAAPNSRLSRVFGIILEALGWPAPSNIPQAIRRAFALDEKLMGEYDEFYDRVQGFADQN